MTQEFSRHVLRVAVAQLCQQLGWNSIQSTPMELLTDVLERYLHNLGHKTHRYSEQFGRTEPNLDDLGLAFKDIGVNIDQLEEYVKGVEPLPFAHDISKFPVPKRNQLNFLRPDDEEYIQRQTDEAFEHIHEHLPSLHAKHDNGNAGQSSPPPVHRQLEQPFETTPGKSTGDKRTFGSPDMGPHAKRPKLVPEEFEYSHYEMKCVGMSVTGEVEPIKAGKMPDSRVPPPMQSSRKCKMPPRPIPKLTIARDSSLGSFIGGDMSDENDVVDVEMEHEEPPAVKVKMKEVIVKPEVIPPPKSPRGRPPKSPKGKDGQKGQKDASKLGKIGRPPKSGKGKGKSPGKSKSPKSVAIIEIDDDDDDNATNAFPLLKTLVKAPQSKPVEPERISRPDTPDQQLYIDNQGKYQDRRSMIDDTLDDVIQKATDETKREEDEMRKKDEEMRKAREQAVFGPPRSPNAIPMKMSPMNNYRAESPDSPAGSPLHLIVRSPSFKEPLPNSPMRSSDDDDVIDSVSLSRSRSSRSPSPLTEPEKEPHKVPPLTLTNMAKKIKKKSLKKSLKLKISTDKEKKKLNKKLKIKTLKKNAAVREKDTPPWQPQVCLTQLPQDETKSALTTTIAKSHGTSSTFSSKYEQSKVSSKKKEDKVKSKDKKHKKSDDERRKDKKKKKNKDKDKDREKSKDKSKSKKEADVKPPVRHKKISISAAIPKLKLKFGNMGGGTESERSTPTLMTDSNTPALILSSSDEESPPPLKTESVVPKIIFRAMLPKSSKSSTATKPPSPKKKPRSPSPKKKFPSPPMRSPSPVREPSPLRYTPSPDSSSNPDPLMTRESAPRFINSPTPSPPPFSDSPSSSRSPSPSPTSPKSKKSSKASMSLPPGIPELPPSRFSAPAAPPPAPKIELVLPPAEEKKAGRGRKKKSAVIVETAGIIYDDQGTKVWICPACTLPDDGSPMIGCDECDDWYHWPCVGIKEEPADNTDWFCRRCTKAKEKDEKPKKKRGRKKKKDGLDTSF